MRNLKVWQPNKKQAVALGELGGADELLYGGARGGGKTQFLLADFLYEINEFGEDWTGVLFRQSYRQLEDIIREAKAFYGLLGRQFEYRKGENAIVFATGATLLFRYLESDEDCENYQGHNYPWIAFDEIGNYRTSFAWDMMSMCNRSARIPQAHIRMRCTANPGGVGHQWIKRKFIEGREPCRMYNILVGHDADGKELYKTQAFVPATVFDNEALSRANPGYIAKLQAMPAHLRRAMLEGDWNIKSGGEFFDKFDTAVHVIEPRVLRGEWQRFYALDWGQRKPWALVKIAVNKDGMAVVYGELYGQGTVDGQEKENAGDRKTSVEVAEMAAESMAQDGVTEMIADYSCWNPDGSTQNTVVDAFEKKGIICIKCRKHGDASRVSGWRIIHELLGMKTEFGVPYLRIFRTCKYLIREFEGMQVSKNNIEDCDSNMPDHALDALRYGLNSDLYDYRGATETPDDYEPPQRVSGYDPVEAARRSLASGVW